jgi:hypothetical protein
LRSDDKYKFHYEEVSLKQGEKKEIAEEIIIDIKLRIQ